MKNAAVIASAGAVVIAISLLAVAIDPLGEDVRVSSPAPPVDMSAETAPDVISGGYVPSADAREVATRSGRQGDHGSLTRVMRVIDLLTLERQTDFAEIIVSGVVVKVDPGQWNSPDGEEWTPDEETSLPMVYRTFYVKPDRILKGSPRFGTPVAFMVTGGIEDVIDGPVNVGDEVIVFGAYYSDENHYGNVYWKKDAYFAASEEYSIYRLTEEGTYRQLAEVPDPRMLETTVEGVQALVADVAR